MREIINEVPRGSYSGYYWLSNAEKPVVVQGSFPEDILEKSLPFVVEANLWDDGAGHSISIRHNGEKHIIVRYNLNTPQGFEQHQVTFIAHRLPGKGRAKFVELWREETDELCNGINTLKPYGRAFIGFEKPQVNQ